MAATALTNSRTRQEWATEINGAWHKSVESILAVAVKCRDAYEQLGADEFKKMADADLNFSPTIAMKFKALAQNSALMDKRTAGKLPASWTVLSALTSLDPSEVKWAQERGLISPQTSRGAAGALVRAIHGNGDVVGKDIIHPRSLPSKDEANAIARETNKAVAASDGKIYTGTSDEEAEAYNDRRNRIYSVIDAINTLYTVACTVSPVEWMEGAETWWLQDLDELNIEQAAGWLKNLDTVRTDA